MKTRIGRKPHWGNKVPRTQSLGRRHLQGDPVRGVLILSGLGRLIRTMESKEPNRPETYRAVSRETGTHGSVRGSGREAGSIYS